MRINFVKNQRTDTSYIFFASKTFYSVTNDLFFAIKGKLMSLNILFIAELNYFHNIVYREHMHSLFYLLTYSKYFQIYSIDILNL